MTELAKVYDIKTGNELDQPLPGLDRRDIYESMKPDELKAHRTYLLDKMSDIEQEVFLINDVLGGIGDEGA